jgi:hypothetical protein
MKTVAINLNTLKIVSPALAATEAGVTVLKDRSDLEKLETKQLVGIYNANRETQIKKFDTRPAGIERLVKFFDTLPEMKVETTVTAKADVNVDAPKVKAAPAAETPKVKATVAATAPKVDATVKVKRIRTEQAAVDRIIQYGRDNAVFTLEAAEKALGIKMTCMRTHMSFINSNGVRFGEVKFVGDRKSKTYTMKVPTRPVPSATKAGKI